MGKRIVAVFEILLLTTLFAFFATFVITTNQNTAITEHTENFVELVRYKGCITQSMYYDFLNGFTTPVDISFAVERQAFLSGTNDATSFEFTKDVIEAIESDDPAIGHIYKMQAGDNIQVTVRKPAGMVYNHVVGAASGNYTGSENPVIAAKGGMVLNEQYAD